MATVLVGVLLLVSAVIAVFVLYRFRKSQELQVWRKPTFLFISNFAKIKQKVANKYGRIMRVVDVSL